MHRPSVTHDVSWGWANGPGDLAEPGCDGGPWEPSRGRNRKKAYKVQDSIWQTEMKLRTSTIHCLVQCSAHSRCLIMEGWVGKTMEFSLHDTCCHPKTGLTHTSARTVSSLKPVLRTLKWKILFKSICCNAQRLYAKPRPWGKKKSCNKHTLGQVVEPWPQLGQRPKSLALNEHPGPRSARTLQCKRGLKCTSSAMPGWSHEQLDLKTEFKCRYDHLRK